jgi:exodeoxyribonuclease VII large subunit
MARVFRQRTGESRSRVDGIGARLGQSLTVFSERSRSNFERCAVRLNPRLIVAPLQRAAEQLARAGDGAMRAYNLSIASKRERLADRACRLHPDLVAAPVARQRERLLSLCGRAEQGVRNLLNSRAREAVSLSQLLRSLSHKSVLDRGFALVRGPDGQVIGRAAEAKAASRLDIEFADGHVPARYSDASVDGEPRAFERKSFASPRRGAPAAKDDGSQGSLL